MEIDYRFGGSSTDDYLKAICEAAPSVSEKQSRLENQLIQAQRSQGESLRKIFSLTGSSLSRKYFGL